MSELCSWSQCAGCISPLRLGDPVSARQWLGRHIGDDAAMARLRLLAGSAGVEATPLILDDQALADQLAARIATGAIRVCGARQAPKLYGVTSTPVAAAAAPAPSSATPAPAPAAKAAPAPAETTFGSGMDPAAMAATLREAARDGVPFCEECARAAAMAAA